MPLMVQGVEMAANMKIKSEAFENNAIIPSKYTCEGQDVTPPLSFEGIPGGARSLAIIVEDPDAPNGTFDHWIAWNLPPNPTLEEGSSAPGQGTNHFGQRRYRGPCPPRGSNHRYFFKVYAIDRMLDLPDGSTKEDLQAAIEGHILAQAQLIGMYHR